MTTPVPLRTTTPAPRATSLTRTATPATASSLIFSQTGSVPIILTASHGGDQRIPNVKERTASEALTLRDSWTEEITLALTNSLQNMLGGNPYGVIAKFHRKYIDANREESLAFEDPGARAYYLAYHSAIRGFVDEIRGKYPGGGLLLDIHGNSKPGFTDKVCRGTENLKTVTALLRKHGIDALIGPNSIMGRLEKSGYGVFPSNTPPRPRDEDPGFNGGYTVGAYGSHNANGIDAIQLEIGSDLRRDSVRDQFTQALAEAIATFYREYLARR